MAFLREKTEPATGEKSYHLSCLTETDAPELTFHAATIEELNTVALENGFSDFVEVEGGVLFDNILRIYINRELSTDEDVTYALSLIIAMSTLREMSES